MKQGWAIKKLREVATVFDGPHATPKTVDSGPIFLGISALEDGVVNLGETRHVTAEDFERWTRRVVPQADDVVFSYETRLGQAAIIPEGLECCLGRRMGLVRFLNGTVVPRFFLYQYISPQFREFLNSRTVRGATVDRISIKEFPSFPTVVPPLPEQQRIVGILDEAFEAIAVAKANAEKNLQNARALFESHLQSVLRSKKWKWKTLGELCDDVEYGSSAKSKAVGKVPVLRMGNIQNGRLDWVNLVYTDDKAEINKYLLKHNDVLFNRTNSPELVGKTAIYKSEMPAIFAGYLIRIHRKEDLLDPDYLTYFLNSQIAFDYGKTVVISSVNQANINGTKLKTYPIPAPSLFRTEGHRRQAQRSVRRDPTPRQHLRAKARRPGRDEAVAAPPSLYRRTLMPALPPIPTGLHPSAQGCPPSEVLLTKEGCPPSEVLLTKEGEATLGYASQLSPQPHRGCVPRVRL